MSKLKIYACSGLGSPKATSRHDGFTYWQNNTECFTNTKAVNSLLSQINLLITEVECLELSDEEVLEKLNFLDFLLCCLYAAQEYASDGVTLQRAGRILGQMVADGAFDLNSLDDGERDINLDKCIARIDETMQAGDDVDVDNEVTRWWNQTIVENNYVGFTPEQIKKCKEYKEQVVSGIGADKDKTKYGSATEYLMNSQDYFLYLYISEEDIKKCNKIIQKKRKKQEEVYKYCKECFVGQFGSEDDMKRIIESSIIKTFNDTPQRVAKEILKNETQKGTKGVGELITAIATIISAIVTLVVAIITACTSYAQEVAVAKYTEAPVNPGAGTADDEDLSEYGMKEKSNGGKSKILLIGGAVLALLLLFKKK